MYQAGPMCLSAETPLQTRLPDQRIRLPIADIARELEVYEEDRVIALLPTVRAALMDPDRPNGQATLAEIEKDADVTVDVIRKGKELTLRQGPAERSDKKVEKRLKKR